jgi:monofunctional biosynthetic peptidoglycan transglycosylase
LVPFVKRLTLLGLGSVLAYLLWLPDVRSLKTENPPTSSLIQLRAQEAWGKGKRLHTKMAWLPLHAISENLVHAVLLAEDDRFYQHHGFDFEQIQVAIQRDWVHKRFVYGGSTLTQQLARTLYLSPHKNLLRKMKEALITILLERSLSKRRILELYLNEVEWGRGIFGAEAAAQFYFGKSARDLTPDEAVAMASILPSPRRWSPLSEAGFIARRRTRLYERMLAAGYIPRDVLMDTRSDFGTEANPEPNAEGLFIGEHQAPSPTPVIPIGRPVSPLPDPPSGDQ